MEVLAVYEDQGRPFARQCAWTLQTALDQGLRDTVSESAAGDARRRSRENSGGDVRAGQSPQASDTGHLGDNLADAILGGDWWQAGGLNWLDNVDVPDDFVTDGTYFPTHPPAGL